MDRLDLQHHAFRLTLDGKLYRAPIGDNIQNVLDVGCGTGIWSIEFADEHPSARVLGTDLSPIQPAQVPPNCEFLIDDCEQDWIFHNQFDYIHTRAMVAAVKNWPRFFRHERELAADAVVRTFSGIRDQDWARWHDAAAFHAKAKGRGLRGHPSQNVQVANWQVGQGRKV
jgi:trans-aconitate methyltransferase